MLAVLLGLCTMLCGTIAAPASADARPGSSCSTSRVTQEGNCTPALAHTSDSEAEETEEEPQEGEEEAATAEVEAEETEGGEDMSSTAGSNGATRSRSPI